MFFTSRCNLDCRYCASRGLIDRGEHRTLSFDEMARAVELFCGYAGSGERRGRVITFTGGEPFLEFDVLSRTIRHIRRLRERFEITVATNGTLLSDEKVDFFRRHRVSLTLSLDGGKRVNDAFRVFRADKAASVHDAVLANLRRMRRDSVEYLYCAATLMSSTLPSVVESMDALLDLGFHHVDLGLGLYEVWTPERLERVRRAARALKERCIRRFDPAALSRGGGDVFRVSFMDDFGAEDRSFRTSVYLSPDGVFFPSASLCCAAAPPARYAVGDLRRGVDFRRLARVHSEVSRFMGTPAPPGNRYLYARLHGRDPARMLEGLQELDRILDEEFGCIARAEGLIRKHRKAGAFERFAREPKHRGKGEIGAFAVRLGGDLRRTREAVDYLLHSPGDEKDLVLRAEDLAASFESVEGAAFYAVLKSRLLGKRLRVAVEGGSKGLGPEQLRFLRDHGILFGYAVVPFGRLDAGRLAERVEHALKKGFERVKLELRGSEGLWSDAELGAMGEGLRALEKTLAMAAARGTGPWLLNLAWGREAGLGEGAADPRAVEEFRGGLDGMRRRLEALGRRRTAFRPLLDGLAGMDRACSGFLA